MAKQPLINFSFGPVSGGVSKASWLDKTVFLFALLLDAGTEIYFLVLKQDEMLVIGNGNLG